MSSRTEGVGTFSGSIGTSSGGAGRSFPNPIGMTPGTNPPLAGGPGIASLSGPGGTGSVGIGGLGIGNRSGLGGTTSGGNFEPSLAGGTGSGFTGGTSDLGVVTGGSSPDCSGSLKGTGGSSNLLPFAFGIVAG